MNILYYGFKGNASTPVFGYIFTILGGIGLITDIILFFVDPDEAKFSIFAASALAIFLGVVAFQDTRVPIVKALVDENVSYIDINKDYEYLEREGDIYVFKVKNVSNEEWEAKINE